MQLSSGERKDKDPAVPNGLSGLSDDLEPPRRLRRSSSRPGRAPESAVVRSRRKAILIDLLKLNGASTIFASRRDGWQVLTILLTC